MDRIQGERVVIGSARGPIGGIASLSVFLIGAGLVQFLAEAFLRFDRNKPGGSLPAQIHDASSTLSWEEPLVVLGVLATVAIALQVAVHGPVSAEKSRVSVTEMKRVTSFKVVAVVIGAVAVTGTLATLINEWSNHSTGDRLVLIAISFAVAAVCVDASRVSSARSLKASIISEKNRLKADRDMVRALETEMGSRTQVLITSIATAVFVVACPFAFFLVVNSGPLVWDELTSAFSFQIVVTSFAGLVGVLAATAFYSKLGGMTRSDAVLLFAFLALLFLVFLSLGLEFGLGGSGNRFVYFFLALVVGPALLLLVVPTLAFLENRERVRSVLGTSFGLHGLARLIVISYKRWSIGRSLLYIRAMNDSVPREAVSHPSPRGFLSRLFAE